MCAKGYSYCEVCKREGGRRYLSRLNRPCPGQDGKCERLCAKGACYCVECRRESVSRLGRPCPGQNGECERLCPKGLTYCRECKREYEVFRAYGLNSAEYRRMEKSQGGVCKICSRTVAKVLHVDHNHKTHVVRELLCMSCNLLIENAKESTEILASAIRYLEKHSRGEQPPMVSTVPERV